MNSLCMLITDSCIIELNDWGWMHLSCVLRPAKVDLSIPSISLETASFVVSAFVHGSSDPTVFNAAMPDLSAGCTDLKQKYLTLKPCV
jgi:hypothetical protein